MLLALSASGLIAGANEVKVPPVLAVDRLPCPEGKPEEGKGGVLVLGPTVAVLAVDDSRLVGVKPQAHLAHPRSERGKHALCLPPALAVHDSIVGVTLERTVRMVPDQPQFERVVE